MNKIVLIALASLMMTACGKSVAKDGNTDITKQPTPTTPVPTAPGNSGLLSLIYANHGEGDVDMPTPPYGFSETLLLSIPTEITLISFASNNNSHYEMALTVNGQVVSSFVWNGTKYVKKNTLGVTSILVHSGDVLNLTNVPQGKTVTVKMVYQK